MVTKQWGAVNDVFANRENGQAVLQVTAPDTITSWVASAFAVSSDVGLGVAPDTARVSILLFKLHCITLRIFYNNNNNNRFVWHR